MASASLHKLIQYVRHLSEADNRSLADRDLLERFLSECDEWAFAELVRRHGPMVLATCRRVLRHEQDAEDALQATFLVLARKATTIRQHHSLGGWLYEVAFRIAVRARSLNARRAALFSVLENEPAMSSVDRKRESLGEAVYQELALLPESYRSVVVLCYLEGKTQGDAARLLATTADAVNSRLKRAREMLRQRLARQGMVLTAAMLGGDTVQAALPQAVVARVARVSILFATHAGAISDASTGAVALAKGALKTMFPLKFKLLSVLTLVLALLGGAMLLPSNAREDHNLQKLAMVRRHVGQDPAPAPKPPAPKNDQKHCIIVWLEGGPSQTDTFDPKVAADVGLFKPIDTSVKGIQFSETLPLLAKQAHHLAILRTVYHEEGDHFRGNYLMHTGRQQNADGLTYPSLGCVLGKELSVSLKAPRFLHFGAKPPNQLIGAPLSPGFLGAKYGPVAVKPNDLPTLESLKVLQLPQEETVAMQAALKKVFAIHEEADEMRNAYGRSDFGASCLIARRLVEMGVPAVEINLGSWGNITWDTHGDVRQMTSLARDLDAGLSGLIKDLHERKLLDNTLIVCMGEFGRTPQINPRGGRDHWPNSFSVMLAGAGIKGGQVIGKTSDDGQILEQPISPQQLLATIYQAVGIDPTKKNRTPDGVEVPLVERGISVVKQALR